MAEGLVIPARRSAAFTRVFAWYVRRLLSRRFHACLIEERSRAVLTGLDAEPNPVIVCMSHQGWWDPLFIVAVGTTLMPSRAGFGAIDRAMHERFGFMARIGAFGIDPDDPASLPAAGEYASGLFAANPRPSMWITPQGRFVDPREPVRIRPGAAAIAARTEGARVAVLNVEYAFWHDQRPEAIMRAREVERPESASTASWHRAILSAMQENADELARMVIARDPSPFVPLIAGRARAVNPVYDLWQRLRGKSARITPRASTGAAR